MIRSFFLLVITYSIATIQLGAQDITGDWYGVLQAQGTQLPLVFHITEEDTELVTTMDSPNQGAAGVATTATVYDECTLTITMDDLKIKYVGTLTAKGLEGTFTQNGFDIPLIMTREKPVAPAPVKRSQDPVEPFPYSVEDVRFVNRTAENIQLAGTLTIPNDVENPPVAILISGSGPQNRDEEIFNHRPFWVLADHLSRNGIAVLRYDDRGVGESEGSHATATTADFATDTQAAIAFLKERNDIDTNNIGLIGHSEGGLIAPMVASKDSSVAFIVLMAGPGISGAEILVTQSRRAAELAGAPEEFLDANDEIMQGMFDVVRSTSDPIRIQSQIAEYLLAYKAQHPDAPISSTITETAIAQQAETFATPWMIYFIKSNPQEFLEDVQCPVLAINGEKDFQVLADLNLPAIEAGLDKANNKDVTVMEFPGLNHLFQTSETGMLAEYESIDETISPSVLTAIEEWILLKIQ